ncbi:MAG TPA: VOC family protein, partial [Thermoanaerobaculia bacterium]|nr:VOC family protein [Thermoanaerobaculia bacterium]
MAIQGARPDDRRIAAHLIVKDLARALDFYRRAFGAEVRYRSVMPPESRVLHAQVKIGESFVLLSEENMGMPEETYSKFESGMKTRSPATLRATTVILETYVEDVDRSFARAIEAGATVKIPVANAFYGDRYGQLVDPFGHIWALASVRETLSVQEVDDRAA